MLLEAGLVQVTLLATIKDALEIHSTILILVDLKVLLQITTGSELLVAVITSKRFLTSVDSLMSYEVADLREGLTAIWVVTLVRLTFIMHSGMLLKGGILSEGLIALLTLERTILIVSSLMLFESLFAIK